jgi:hypothetical protein
MPEFSIGRNSTSFRTELIDAFLNSLNVSGRLANFWGKIVLEISLDGAHENSVEISDGKGSPK